MFRHRGRGGGDKHDKVKKKGKKLVRDNLNVGQKTMTRGLRKTFFRLPETKNVKRVRQCVVWGGQGKHQTGEHKKNLSRKTMQKHDRQKEDQLCPQNVRQLSAEGGLHHSKKKKDQEVGQRIPGNRPKEKNDNSKGQLWGFTNLERKGGTATQPKSLKGSEETPKFKQRLTGAWGTKRYAKEGQQENPTGEKGG